MKLYIPRVGSELRLEADWSFDVFYDYRNQAACKAAGNWVTTYDWNSRPAAKPLTVPAGTSLVVDRIYIRQPNKSGDANDYDSVTFFVRSGGLAQHLVPGARFFARLDDCNTMEVEVVGENRPCGLSASAQFKREAAGKPAPKPKTSLGKTALNLRQFGIDLEMKRKIAVLVNRKISEGDAAVKLFLEAAERWATEQNLAGRHLFWEQAVQFVSQGRGAYTWNDDRTSATQNVSVTALCWNARGHVECVFLGTVTFDFPSGRVTNLSIE